MNDLIVKISIVFFVVCVVYSQVVLNKYHASRERDGERTREFSANNIFMISRMMRCEKSSDTRRWKIRYLTSVVLGVLDFVFLTMIILK